MTTMKKGERTTYDDEEAIRAIGVEPSRMRDLHQAIGGGKAISHSHSHQIQPEINRDEASDHTHNH